MNYLISIINLNPISRINHFPFLIINNQIVSEFDIIVSWLVFWLKTHSRPHIIWGLVAWWFRKKLAPFQPFPNTVGYILNLLWPIKFTVCWKICFCSMYFNLDEEYLTVGEPFQKQDLMCSKKHWMSTF